MTDTPAPCFARLTSDGPEAYGTRVTLPDGSEVGGLTSVRFTAEAGETNRIEAVIAMTSADVEGILEVWAPHPVTSDLKKVQKIVFTDGSEWIAP